MFRIGHGYDAHAFAEGRTLILGGVIIPYPSGMQAHSDGDVVVHAVCDALLGAAAMGDIGQHFPDTDDQYASADSRLFLRHIVKWVTAKQYSVTNIDVTVLAQAPKLAPYIEQMRINIASDLGLTCCDVNIKATTTEKMGFVGRQEGISCYAVALLSTLSARI